jgi:hypothetical protein
MKLNHLSQRRLKYDELTRQPIKQSAETLKAEELLRSGFPSSSPKQRGPAVPHVKSRISRRRQLIELIEIQHENSNRRG